MNSTLIYTIVGLLILVIITIIVIIFKRREARLKEEMQKAKEEVKRAEEARIAAEKAAKEEAERKAAEEAKRVEEARIAAEKAAKEEAKRKAAEEAKRAEEARIAAEKAAKEEAERKAAEEAKCAEEARIAAEKAAKEEAERKAAEEARRAEEARIAAEKAAKEEAERKAAEEAKRAEEARIAAEKAAKEEAERKAAEADIDNMAEKLLSRKGKSQKVNPKFIENLNAKQKEAVLATEGRVKIVAGAGSGKTRVLAHRYAHLVEDLGVNPANILCMTFTNKAAQEMKSRIGKLVQIHNVNDFICTIHGFCVKFLRKEIYRIGYPKNFTIIDEDDSKAFAKQVMEELGEDRTVQTVKQFLEIIGNTKKNFPYVGHYIVPNVEISEKDKKDSFVRYLFLQKKYYALDFIDIIEFTLYILNNFEEARNYWQQKFNYVQIDEVQDCNRSDWQIIHSIASHYGNLFIVGDPDQAIYEWRGAKPAVFVNFEADKTIILNENYRSTPNILNVANSIIVNNKKRIEKDLVTHIPTSKIVLYSHSKSEPEEGTWIANQITTLVKNGAKYSDIAILYRASYLSRNIEQAFMKKGISYTIWGGVRFFERKEIKDCICYLRVIDNNDDMSFKRVINEPSRKFGKVTLQKLADLAESEKASLYETLKNHLNDKAFNKEPITAFVNLIEEAKSKADVISISELLEFVLINSGLKELYRIDEDEDRLENIAELINSIKFYETTNVNEDITLNTYLQDIALYTNADYKEDKDTVKLMTIHQAKGLEFPYVFVCGLSEGIFPNHRSIRERKQDGLEEERRLMYVAVTRAEKLLFLTDSEGFNITTRSEKCPSRFITEITGNLVKIEGNLDPILLEQTKNLVQSLDDEINGVECPFVVGDIVEHEAFGIGKIIEINSHDNSCKVIFTDMARFLNHKSLIKFEGTEVLKSEISKKLDKLIDRRQKPIIKDFEVNDILSVDSQSLIVKEVKGTSYRVYNFDTGKTYSIEKSSKVKFVYRPKINTYYLLLGRFKQNDQYFYVKDYKVTKDDILLNGMYSNGIGFEMTTFWVGRLVECSEEEFMKHCTDVEIVKEFKKKK